MITFADIKIDKDVPLPATPEPKAKEANAPRMTLADKLSELKVGESIFLEGKKKASLSSQIVTSRKAGKVVGKFTMVEYGGHGDNDAVYPEIAGVRIWRTEDAKPALSVAAE